MKKLPKQDSDRISKKLESVLGNPFGYFEKLEGMSLFRLRVGKFRVIAAISFGEKKITCVSVGLRKNVYERL